jgi:ribonuclease-3
MIQYSMLLKKLNYSFKNNKLLLCSLTHKSAAKKKNIEVDIHNERLEFLGDAVLSLVAADFLYNQKQRFNEGDLSRLRAQFVCQDNLSKAARELNLGSYIISERTLRSDAVLSDALEALIGAVFIDGGLEAAREVIFHVLGKPSLKLTILDKDAKTKLQELIQATYNKTPKYIVLEKKGPAHAPSFIIGVTINEQIISQAQGESIKGAAQKAAELALEILDERSTKA